MLRAYNENRGRSAPVSLNATGSLTLEPAAVSYTKPLMVLTDEFSASGADMFPAIIQSNNRGPLFGMRTMGAGGSVVGFNGPAFTESFFRSHRVVDEPRAPGADARLSARRHTSKTSACGRISSRTI